MTVVSFHLFCFVFSPKKGNQTLRIFTLKSHTLKVFLRYCSFPKSRSRKGHIDKSFHLFSWYTKLSTVLFLLESSCSCEVQTIVRLDLSLKHKFLIALPFVPILFPLLYMYVCLVFATIQFQSVFTELYKNQGNGGKQWRE